MPQQLTQTEIFTTIDAIIDTDGVKLLKIPWDVWAFNADMIIKHFSDRYLCGSQELTEVPEFCVELIGHAEPHGWEVAHTLEKQFGFSGYS